MGSLLATLTCGVADVACCCGSAACRLCCKSCPSCTNSTSTRVVYAVLFVAMAISAWLMLEPSIGSELKQMDKYTGHINCTNVSHDVCAERWGTLGVDRVMFALACFHALLALITIGVKSSRDPRSAIHNGMWFFKVLILIGATVGAFFIDNTFFVGWDYVGLVGAFFFVLFQLVLLVDFAHSWSQSWVERMEEGSSCYKYALLAVTGLFYCLSIAITVCLYVFYAQAPGHSCDLSKFFVSFNLVFGVIMTATSIHPRVQDALPYSGLLQPSIIWLYSSYLTWSAVSNVEGPCSQGPDSSTLATVCGAFLTFVAVAYSSLRSSSKSQIGQLGLKQEEQESLLLPTSNDDDDDDEDGRQRVVDNEKEGVLYSWSFFHLTFAVAALYLMEVLTDWAVIKDGTEAGIHIGSGMASVWVTTVSSWLACLLYIWSLIAPILLPDRDFS